MWGLALGIASFALAVYGLFRDSEAASGDSSREQSLALDPNAARAAETAIVRCGMTRADWVNTDRYTRRFFGGTLSVPRRVAMLRNVMPVELFPEYVKRVECAIRTGRG